MSKSMLTFFWSNNSIKFFKRRKYLSSTFFYIFLFFCFLFLIRLFYYLRAELLYNGGTGHYAIEVSNILAGKGMITVSPPFVYYFYTMLSLAFSDIFLGIKIGNSLLFMLTSLFVFLITKHITEDVRISLFSTFLFAFSPFNFFILAEFHKNLAGTLFGLFLILLSLEPSKKNSTQKYFLFTMVAVLLLLSHLPSSAYFFALIIPVLFLDKKFIHLLIILFFMSASFFIYNVPLDFFVIGKHTLSAIITVIIFLPFLPFGIFYTFKKHQGHLNLLFAWLIMSIIFTLITENEWSIRFAAMSSAVLVIFAAIAAKYLKGPLRGGLLLFSVLATILLFTSVFFSVKPELSTEEYNFFKEMLTKIDGEKISLASNSINTFWWLKYIGYDIELIENISKINTSVIIYDLKYFNEIKGEIINSTGRFVIVRIK